ncbi:Clp protease N-terminal domain-containing protein [Actinokineospora sp. G85]|uniref:Clp protease N-terminal domain-containing protein n=1 Tax=Actinokineospora sp. G85 TaxID=3406626 RepID=UPI003C714932
MFERFTDAARVTVRDGVHIAELDHAARVEPEHLLLGMLRQSGTAASEVLAAHEVTEEGARTAIAAVRRRGGLSTADTEALGDLGIDVDSVVAAVERGHGEGALARSAGRRRSHPRWRAPLAPDTKKVLQRCLREALDRRERRIGDEHILLALLGTRGTTADVLATFGVTYDGVRAALTA